MARIKARSMNRVSASSGTSSQPPATPTGLVSPVASAPGTPGVAPGTTFYLQAFIKDLF